MYEIMHFYYYGYIVVVKTVQNTFITTQQEKST